MRGQNFGQVFSYSRISHCLLFYPKYFETNGSSLPVYTEYKMRRAASGLYAGVVFPHGGLVAEGCRRRVLSSQQGVCCPKAAAEAKRRADGYIVAVAFPGVVATKQTGCSGRDRKVAILKFSIRRVLALLNQRNVPQVMSSGPGRSGRWHPGSNPTGSEQQQVQALLLRDPDVADTCCAFKDD